MKKIIVIISLLFLLITPIYAMSVSDLVVEKINNEDGFKYAYDPYWSQYETIELGNLDNDPEEEIVVSFGASYRNDEEDNIDITMHFWQIYDLVDGKYKLIKTTWANQYPGGLILKDLNGDQRKEILIFSHGGAHYTNIYLYQWQNKEYKKIWEDGSGCGVEVLFNDAIPKIWIGIPNWKKPGWCYAAEPLWAVYEWNGGTFVYNEENSDAGIEKEYIAYWIEQ